MAATLDTDRHDLTLDDLRGPIRADGLSHEFLAPVLAGAFARGMAEAFDLLGIPALFLDREGRVLHATDPAGPALASGLQVRAGHVLAKSRRDNRALAEFLAVALRDPGARPSVVLGASRLTLRALPVNQKPLGDQLLHAVVVIGEGSRAGIEPPALPAE